MLFLAVFCGFLAEWQLERTIENHREEVYIESIVEDIRADVAQTNKIITDLNTRVFRVDTLLLALASRNEIQVNSNKAYKLWLQTTGFPDFAQNDRTIQQLKNSGALRLIRNKAVSDKIVEYDQAVRLLGVTQNNMNSIAANNAIFYQIFDFIALNKPNPTPVPITEIGSRLLNEAYASRFFWRINLVGLRQRLNTLNKKGIETAGFIEKEYHVK